MLKARLALAALGILTSLGLSACNPFLGSPVPVSSTPRCEEDQPCWDCSTMGNRICGPTR